MSSPVLRRLPLGRASTKAQSPTPPLRSKKMVCRNYIQSFVFGICANKATGINAVGTRSEKEQRKQTLVAQRKRMRKEECQKYVNLHPPLLCTRPIKHRAPGLHRKVTTFPRQVVYPSSCEGNPGFSGASPSLPGFPSRGPPNPPPPLPPLHRSHPHCPPPPHGPCDSCHQMQEPFRSSS
jgi:hypothetical protein